MSKRQLIKCPGCGSKNTEMKNNKIVCNKCGHVLKYLEANSMRIR